MTGFCPVSFAILKQKEEETMAFDFKKEFREFYLPPQKPQLLFVPPMQYASVAGEGDPNAPSGAFQRAVGLLFTLAYTVKMSKMGNHRMTGYFDFVVPPLEGLWQQKGGGPVDLSRKQDFGWTALIRLPDFVTEEEFAWARQEAARKKGIETKDARLLTLSEGMCVQMLHRGPYDQEPASIRQMEQFAAQAGYVLDLSDQRRHHEIYLSDARKTAPDKMRTVIRLPVRKEAP